MKTNEIKKVYMVITQDMFLQPELLKIFSDKEKAQQFIDEEEPIPISKSGMWNNPQNLVKPTAHDWVVGFFISIWSIRCGGLFGS